jgi:hypothetical protein
VLHPPLSLPPLPGYVQVAFPPAVKVAAGQKVFNTLVDGIRLGDSAGTVTGAYVGIVSFKFPASVGTITAARIELTIAKVTGVNPLTGKYDGLTKPTTIRMGYVRGGLPERGWVVWGWGWVVGGLGLGLYGCWLPRAACDRGRLLCVFHRPPARPPTHPPTAPPSSTPLEPACWWA